MEKITVREAGEIASSAFQAACGSAALLAAFNGEWKRTTLGMSEISMQSSGDLAVSTLKSAMDKIQTRPDQKANLVGMFCNEWNRLAHPDTHRVPDDQISLGARVSRSPRG